MLTGISKKIIVSRLYDKGINIKESDLDGILINPDNFKSNNEMYDSIVNNWGMLIIE